MTLNVNSTGAKVLRLYGTTVMSSGTSTTGWRAGAVVPFVYDGTNWIRFFWENTTYSISSVLCGTTAETAAKVSSNASYYALREGNIFEITFRYSNTAQSALTLNVGSTGAKPLYINGEPSSAANYILPAGKYIVYYDGTNYYVNTNGTAPISISGNAETASRAIADSAGNNIINTYATQTAVNEKQDKNFILEYIITGGSYWSLIFLLTGLMDSDGETIELEEENFTNKNELMNLLISYFSQETGTLTYFPDNIKVKFEIQDDNSNILYTLYFLLNCYLKTNNSIEFYGITSFNGKNLIFHMSPETNGSNLILNAAITTASSGNTIYSATVNNNGELTFSNITSSQIWVNISDSMDSMYIPNENYGYYFISINNYPITLVLALTGMDQINDDETYFYSYRAIFSTIKDNILYTAYVYQNEDDSHKSHLVTSIITPNQNAFSTIKIDTTSINADSETDTFQIITGNNITLTPDVANKKVTINATDTTYRAATSAPPNIASQGDYGQSQAYAREDHTHGISVGEGDSNGQVKIAGQNASVKGLGTAAYKNITDNTTAALVSLDDTNLITARTLYNAGYLPTSGGTMSGAIISNVTPTSDTHLTNKAYVDNLVNSSFAANDAMIFKGTLNGGNSETNTAYTPAADRGHTYKIADPGFINGEKVETGDTLICIVDSTVEATSSNVNSVKNNWTIVQANLDGVVIGPASAINSHVAVFDTNSGKLIRDGGYTIAAHVPANAQFTDTTYSAGTGLDLSGTTFNHSNSVTAQETEAVYPIKIDAQGHIKSYGTAQTILSLGNTDSTAFPGNQGLVDYTHATNKGSAFNSGLYKITTNDQGHVINAVAVTKTDITALGIPAENTNTDTKVNVRTRGVEKSYILADFTAPGTTAAAHEAVADTNIYMDTYSGRLAATEYKVGEAVVLQYNNTTSALEFNFI